MAARSDDACGSAVFDALGRTRCAPHEPAASRKAVRVGNLSDAAELLDLLGGLGCADAGVVVLPRGGVVEWV